MKAPTNSTCSGASSRTSGSGRARRATFSRSSCFPRTSEAVFTRAPPQPAGVLGRWRAMCAPSPGERPMPRKGVRRLRGNLKTAIAAAITKAHDHGLAGPLARRAYRPLVLGYHRVVEDFDAEARVEMPSMLTSRVMFERHLECLGRSFTFVSLDEIGDRLLNGLPFDRPVAAITFDDGYQDVYELALPILERKGIPAAMFVVTDLVGRPAWQIHDKLYHLVAKAFRSWDDPRSRMFGL